MIYFILNPDTDAVKIGYTENIDIRFSHLQTHNSARLKILALIDGDRAQEKDLHGEFSKFKLSGEWFSFSSELESYIQNLKDKLPIPSKYTNDDEYIHVLNCQYGKDVIVIRTKDFWHRNLKPSEFASFMALASQLKPNSMVIEINLKVRKKISEETSLSDAHIKKGINNLLSTNCLKRISRGVYMVNPSYICLNKKKNSIRSINKYEDLQSV